METYIIKASHPQHTPAGRLVSDMHYSGFIDNVLTMDEYSGFPHNGGMHSLTLYLTQKDFNAFIDVVREKYKKHPGLSEFVEHSIEIAKKLLAR